MVSEDCNDHPFFVCNSENICEHKGVFPYYPIEIGGLIILIISMALCNVAGIGGGGIVITFISIFFKFSTKYATAISSFTIFCSATSRFIVQLRQKHPQKEAVVIDYGIATLMMPTSLIGSFIGAIFNVSFPSLVINIMLTVAMILIAIYSFYKTYKMCK